MLGFFKPRQADVLSHWYALIPNFATSTKEFYETVERELKTYQAPGLELSRVEFSEGGILSDKREYLRMSRERLVFDICAAPFGTSYFFSCRFAEIPAVIKLWQILLLFFGFWLCLWISFVISAKIFGAFTIFIWPLEWIAFISVAVYVLRNAVAIGLKDIDAALIKSPVVGPVYERFFRKESYYRGDTRLMYLDTVNSVVKTLVEETTGAKGIKLIRFNEYNPVLHELYRPSIVTLPRETQPV